jgi:hypothetical protein
MRKTYWILIICMLYFRPAKSQNLEEVHRLEDIISDYFNNSRNELELEAIGKMGRPQEAFFVILDIDSAGRVETVHLFTENTRDSGYAIIKNLKPADFRNWQEEKYSLKSIVLPVIVLNGERKRNYIFYLADMTNERRATRRIVVGKTVILGWPYIIRDKATPSFQVK